MNIGKLFLSLGIKTDEEALNKAKRGLESFRKNALILQAAFVGATFALDRFVDGTIKSSVSLQNLNLQTGLSIEKLQQWQQAGQLSDLNISAEQVSQSIANLQKSLTDIKLGRGNIAPFQLLGIDTAGKDAFQILDNVRDAIKGLDNSTASNLISQLGLDPSFINILKLSREEFDKLGQNVFLSKEQRQNVVALGTAITSLKLRLKALKDQAVAKLAPELKKITTDFFQWLKDNGDKVIRTIAMIAQGFSNFVKSIARAAGLITELISSISSAQYGLQGLAVVAAGLAVSFAPLAAVAALIIAFLDDIATFRKGGESLIGEALNGLGISDEIGKAFLDGFMDGIKFLMEGLGIAIKTIADLILALGNVVGAVVGVIIDQISRLVEFVTKAKNLVKEIAATVKGKISSGISSGKEFVSNTVDAAEVFGDKVADKIANIFGFGGNASPVTAAGGFTPIPATAGGSVFNSPVTNNITMNITGTNDPRETANITIENLKSAQALINNSGF